MTFNSSYEIVEEYDVRTPLLYSSPTAIGGHADTWIQPSIANQTIDIADSTIIDGIYVQARPQPINIIFNPELELELKAWEMASDEALVIFESHLD